MRGIKKNEPSSQTTRFKLRLYSAVTESYTTIYLLKKSIASFPGLRVSMQMYRPVIVTLLCPASLLIVATGTPLVARHVTYERRLL